MSDTNDKISFTRTGMIKRDDVRIGWIERNDDYDPVTWRVRFTPASNRPGLLPEKHFKLSDEKRATITFFDSISR